MSRAGKEPRTEDVASRSVRPAVVLLRTVRSVGADRIFLGYIVFLLACCGVFCLIEPETFSTFGCALWYVFQIITTIGFGDVVPGSTAVRAISMVVGLSALFVVALITGVVVSFFNERMRLRRNESFIAFERNMEHLSELSPEELKAMEEQYRKFVKGVKAK